MPNVNIAHSIHDGCNNCHQSPICWEVCVEACWILASVGRELQQQTHDHEDVYWYCGGIYYHICIGTCPVGDWVRTSRWDHVLTRANLASVGRECQQQAHDDVYWCCSTPRSTCYLSCGGLGYVPRTGTML
jgi:hypothetical protein